MTTCRATTILHIAPCRSTSDLDLTDVVTEADNRHGTQPELCRKSSVNSTTRKFFAFAPSWVPDPGDFRKSPVDARRATRRPEHR